MYIVLKDADFSKNNIGHVDLNLPMDDLTIEILKKFSATPTDSIQKALNTFIINLKNSGLISKISSLYIPVLASSVTESFKDVIGNDTLDITGKAYGVTIGKGVYLNGTSLLTFAIPNTIDFHAMAFNVDAVPVVSGIGYSVGQGVYGFGRRIFNSGTTPGAFIGDGSNRVNSDANLGSVLGVQILSNDGVVILLGDNGQIFTGVPSVNFANKTSMNLNVGSTLINGINFGIYSTGGYLSQNETAEYMSYVTSFMGKALA